MKKRILCLAIALSVGACHAAELMAHLKLGTPKPTAQALLDAVHKICPLPFVEMQAAAMLQRYGYPNFENLSSETGPGWLVLNVNGVPRTVAAIKLSPAAAKSTAVVPGLLRSGDWMLSCRDSLPEAERDAALKAAADHLDVLEPPIPSIARVRVYPACFQLATDHLQKVFPADHAKTSAQLAQAMDVYFKMLAHVDTDLSLTADSIELSNTVRALPNTALARFLAGQKGAEVPQAVFLSREDHSIGVISHMAVGDVQKIGARSIQMLAAFYTPEQTAQMQTLLNTLIQRYADSDGTQAMVLSLGKGAVGDTQSIANVHISLDDLQKSYAEGNVFLQLLLSAITDQVKVEMSSRLMEGTPSILETETRTTVPQEVPTQASLEKYRALAEKDPNTDADKVLVYETLARSEQVLSYEGITPDYVVQSSKAEDTRTLLARVTAKKTAEAPLSSQTGTTLPPGYFLKGMVMIPRFLQELDAAVHDEQVTPLGLKLNALSADAVPPATFASFAQGDALNSTLSVPLKSLAAIAGLFLCAPASNEADPAQ